jgi:hypothetical protein
VQVSLTRFKTWAHPLIASGFHHDERGQVTTLIHWLSQHENTTESLEIVHMLHSTLCVWQAII